MEFSDPRTAPRKEVEEAIKEWRAKREKRLEADKAAAKLKKEEDGYLSFLMEAFMQQKLEGMIIDGRVTGLSSTSKPVVDNKEKLIAHIKETGNLELLEFRLSAKAAKEHIDEEGEVPGVKMAEFYGVYDRKV